jgi:hypothetical protein
MRAKDYFPSGNGDSWRYNVIHNGVIASGETTRSIFVVDSTHFSLTESNISSSSSTTQYTRSAGGHVLGPVDLLGSSAPASAQKIVGSVAEYVEPFFPVGGELKRVRQGDWGADLDGDGVNESFRLEFSQTLVGFETLQTLMSFNVETAHIRTALTFTIVPSNPSKAELTVVATENSWWAAGMGLIQANRETRLPDGSVTTDLLRATGGTVNGKDISDGLGLDGTVIKITLPHTSLIYDKTRSRYLATIPGSVMTNGNSVAMINAATGAVTYTRSLGSEPSVLALSNAGDFLYVGLKGSGEVVKFRMSDMVEQWRVRLQNDAFFGQATAENLSVDPTNADVVAVSTQWSGSSPRHAGVALLRSGVMQPNLTQGHTGSNLIVFGGDGQTLYGYNDETTEFGLRRITVLPDGLKEVQVVSTNAGFGSVGLGWTSDGLWLGASKYQASDLSLTGSVGGSVAQCSPLNNPAKAVCLETDFSNTTKRLVVVDANSLVASAFLTYRKNINTPAAYLVSGPANQVALRLDDVYSPSFYYSSIWLFNSPALN